MEDLDNIQIENRFNRIYAMEIAPYISEIAKTRYAKIMQAVFAFIALFAVFICLVMYLIKGDIHHSNKEQLVAVFTVIELVSTFLIPYYICHMYAKYLKEKFLNKLFSALGFLRYAKGDLEIISSEQLSKSKLFDFFNKREDDDNFIGKYEDIEYSICETKLFHHRTSHSYSGRNKSSTETIFNGAILFIKTSSDIKNNISIKLKGAAKTILNSVNKIALAALPIIVIFAFIKGGSATGGNAAMPQSVQPFFLFILTLVIIGFIGFLMLIFQKDKRKVTAGEYDIYCGSKKIEKSEIATPAFIKLIDEFRLALSSHNAKVLINKDGILIALSVDKNLFEPKNIFFETKDMKGFKAAFDEMLMFFNFVKCLRSLQELQILFKKEEN